MERREGKEGDGGEEGGVKRRREKVEGRYRTEGEGEGGEGKDEKGGDRGEEWKGEGNG